MNDFQDKDSISIKVTMIGSVGVGKSCIIDRFTKDTFDSLNKSTIGANYYKKELNIHDKNITLDIWDTAGQEKFHSMGRHFYKNSNIIVIVYDITNINSFEDIKNYWYNDVKEHGEKYKVIGIVGNKFDLYDQDGINEIDEKVVQEFMNNINNDKNSRFLNMKVSAKTGVNIKNLFTKLVGLYLEKEFNILIRQESLQKASTLKIKEQKSVKKKKKCCK